MKLYRRLALSVCYVKWSGPCIRASSQLQKSRASTGLYYCSRDELSYHYLFVVDQLILLKIHGIKCLRFSCFMQQFLTKRRTNAPK